MTSGRPILIAGPTASGKSAIAARLARDLGGIVINADSMQVYRELRVLTARPSAEEEARVPHALYGFVAASDAYSAGRFAVDVAAALKDAREKGLRPIIVGGTGLYFKALLDGLSPMPAGPRRRARPLARRWPPPRRRASCTATLAARDPRWPSGWPRAIRNASCARSRCWRRPASRSPSGSRARAQPVLEPPTRCASSWRRSAMSSTGASIARFEAMVPEGALDEVARLAAVGLDPALPIMNALGVRPLLRHLRGETRSRRGGGRRTDRDAAVRQAAANLGAKQYDCVEMAILRKK